LTRRLPLLLFLLLIVSIISTVLLFIPLFSASQTDRVKTDVAWTLPLEKSLPAEDVGQYVDSKISCRFHTCFEINNCSIGINDLIGVYVYPDIEFITEESGENKRVSSVLSVEYRELISAVKESSYYQPNASKACVLIPSIDTLSQDVVDIELVSRMLHGLPYWSGGENHVVFNMLPGSPHHYNTTPDFYYGKAMLAGGGFSQVSYRYGYDLSVPVFNHLTRSESLYSSSYTSDRTHLLAILSPGSSQLPQSIQHKLSDLEKDYDAVLLEPCPVDGTPPRELPRKRCHPSSDAVVAYPAILQSYKFCLLVPGVRYGTPDFTDAMMTGCIPVVLDDDYVLPFSEVLDWPRATVRVWLGLLREGVGRIRNLPDVKVTEMREQVLFLYRRYFFSMETIVHTTLDILNERVFPTSVHTYEYWNSPPYNPTLRGKFQYNYPVALDLPAPPPSEGFTAVVLAYDRVPMLFSVIQSIAKAPSLAKILVVWNNVNKSPPPSEEWPRIKQKIQVVRSKENKLSNRFYPYHEIKTACVLAVDDDITMLTADELEFGYKAWQEFPNRLVGFPGRVHVKDYQTNKWRYESEWLNNISLVLTGAAFYHKFYHYQYTHIMPRGIRDWVDDHMNCEDIAMNFLIANYSGLPPLKTSPRKKFKCPTCTSEGSLWSDPEHYLERDECINLFQSFFFDLPLQTVKFRLDPVLYKLDSPLNRYPNMGEL
jgi:glucuronyl/N-acetylglucosaminyl transferase EXT2